MIQKSTELYSIGCDNRGISRLMEFGQLPERAQNEILHMLVLEVLDKLNGLEKQRGNHENNL